MVPPEGSIKDLKKRIEDRYHVDTSHQLLHYYHSGLGDWLEAPQILGIVHIQKHPGFARVRVSTSKRGAQVMEARAEGGMGVQE